MKCKHKDCTGTLVRVGADEAYNPGYYACETCDSTYSIQEFQKKAYALSYQEFKASLDYVGITDDNVESKDKTALIEIMGEQYLLIHPFYFKKDHSNVIRLVFDDVDEPLHVPLLGDVPDEREYIPVVPMNEEQGKLIVEFVKANQNVGTFIVHCAAGVSRSGAVAKFITEYFGGEDKDFYKLNPYTKPNQRILTILRNLVQ